MDIWGLFVQAPLINVLIVMAHYLGNNFGLAIIALTIIVNLAMLPLTLSQLRSTKALQVLQPKLMELQQKYSKDRQKLAQEQMALYKTSGIKPAGCAVTMVIQMPVWLALYQAIMLCLAVAPEGLLNLSKYLYSWPVLYSVLPLGNDFLGLDLAATNNYFMAIMVGATMWVQQKMSMNVAPTDPRQRQQTQMMLWMMPLMFTFLALTFPSGLSMYWITSTIFRIAFQYKITGWGGLSLGGSKDSGPDVKRLKKFTGVTEEKPSDINPEVLGSDTDPSKKASVIYPEKPSKQRYQPGKDRAQHHPKK